jgi:acyl-CoA thioesterase-1
MGRRHHRLKPVLMAIALLLGLVQPALACRLVVLGDSLTAGYGVAASEAFPARLALALAEAGVDCAVLDAGVSGDTTAGGLSRLGWVLADEPTHLLVALGGNDLLRALPVEQMEANLDAIVAGAREAGVSVMLAGMVAPPNLGPDYGRSVTEAFERVAARHDVPLYRFFLEGVITKTELMQRDGIHPNAEGVKEIVARILPSILDWLQRADQ